MAYYRFWILAHCLFSISSSYSMDVGEPLSDVKNKPSLLDTYTDEGGKSCYSFQHNINFSKDQLEGLINKGYQALGLILSGEENSIQDKLEFLENYAQFEGTAQEENLKEENDNDSSEKNGSSEDSSPQKTTPPPELTTQASFFGTLYSYTPSIYTPYNIISGVASYVLPGQKSTPIEIKAPLSKNDAPSLPISYSEGDLPNMSKSFLKTPTVQDRLETVVSIIWALYDKAFKLNQPLIGGMIVVEDDQQLLYTYLQNYCSFATGVPYDQLSNSFLWGSNLAYSRKDGRSSHYRGRTDGTEGGIDARFGNDRYRAHVFPCSYTHLLFGRAKTLTTLDKKFTFLKIEAAGLGDKSSTVEHAVDYVRSATNYALYTQSAKEFERKEHHLPLPVAEKFYNILDLLRVEPLPPKNFLEYYTDWMPTLFSNLAYGSLKPNHLCKPKKFDIATIYQIYFQIDALRDSTPQIQEANEQLFSCLTNLYPAESLHLRNGNEAIIMDEDLMLVS